MIVPTFTGVDAVASTPGLGNPAAFIPVTDEYGHPDHPEVFAAGVTDGRWHSISINELGAVCSSTPAAITTDRVFGDGKTHVTSGPHAHWGEVVFEKALLLSRKRGSVAF